MKRRTKIIAGAVATGVVLVAAGGAVVALDGDDGGLTASDFERATEAAVAEVGGGTVTGTERDDAGGFEVDVVRPDGAEAEVHLSPDFDVVRTEVDDARDDDRFDDDGPDGDDLVGEELERARAAALEIVPDGVVTDAEREPGGYEVEVVRPDGREVDVHLDESFAVTVTVPDVDD